MWVCVYVCVCIRVCVCVCVCDIIAKQGPLFAFASTLAPTVKSAPYQKPCEAESHQDTQGGCGFVCQSESGKRHFISLSAAPHSFPGTPPPSATPPSLCHSPSPLPFPPPLCHSPSLCKRQKAEGEGLVHRFVGGGVHTQFACMGKVWRGRGL